MLQNASASHQFIPIVAPTPLLISFSEASHLIGVAEQTARDWLYKKKFPVPTVKVNGKRMVPYGLLKNYIDGLIKAELSRAS